MRRIFTGLFVLFLLGCQRSEPPALKNATESLRRSTQAFRQARWSNLRYLEGVADMKRSLVPLLEKSKFIHGKSNQLQRLLDELSRQLRATSLSVGDFFAQNDRLQTLPNAVAACHADIIDSLHALRIAANKGKVYGIRIREGQIDTLAMQMPLSRWDNFALTDVSRYSHSEALALLQSIAVDAEISSLRAMNFLSDNIGVDGVWSNGWMLQAQETKIQTRLGEDYSAEIYVSRDAKYTPLTTPQMQLNGEPIAAHFDNWQTTIALRDTGWQQYRLSARVLLPDAKDSSTLEANFRVFVAP